MLEYQNLNVDLLPTEDNIVDEIEEITLKKNIMSNLAIVGIINQATCGICYSKSHFGFVHKVHGDLTCSTCSKRFPKYGNMVPEGYFGCYDCGANTCLQCMIIHISTNGDSKKSPTKMIEEPSPSEVKITPKSKEVTTGDPVWDTVQGSMLEQDVFGQSRCPFCTQPMKTFTNINNNHAQLCLLYTSPSPRDRQKSRMPSSA
eukprot:TRINITY_DN9757_c0_g1_i1.p1 TRINITY_DN9757_c0_g1~~TRINITY_DN9757_c0_g1_i1.p1  ORF type:complete len:202 (-),score=4.61 TRINITY_DN9757_c0_g1_i1:50-655(-)